MIFHLRKFHELPVSESNDCTHEQSNCGSNQSRNQSIWWRMYRLRFCGENAAIYAAIDYSRREEGISGKLHRKKIEQSRRCGSHRHEAIVSVRPNTVNVNQSQP